MIEMLKDKETLLCIKRVILKYIIRKLKEGRKMKNIDEILEYAERIEIEGKRNMNNKEYSKEEREEWREIGEEALLLEAIEEEMRSKDENISFIERRKKETEEKAKMRTKLTKYEKEERIKPIQLINCVESIRIDKIEGDINNKNNKLMFTNIYPYPLFFIGPLLTDNVHRMSFKAVLNGGIGFYVVDYNNNNNNNNNEHIMSLNNYFGVFFSFDGLYYSIHVGDDYYWYDEHDINKDDIVTLEVDLRSKEPSERTIHVFINDSQLSTFSSCLPEKVRYGMKFSENNSEIEFVSYETYNYAKAEKVSSGREIIFEMEKNERRLIKERKDEGICLSSIDNLSSLSLNLLGNDLRIEENKIEHSGEHRYETCIFNDIMTEGVYRLTLTFDNIKDSEEEGGLFGLIDSSLNNIEDNDIDISKVKGIVKYNSASGEMINSNNEIVGQLESIISKGVVIVEVDLRSEKEEKRTLKYFINGTEQSLFFTCLPSSVQFILSFKRTFSSIEFISLEILKEAIGRVKEEDIKGKGREFKRKKIEEEEEDNNINIATNLPKLSYYDVYEYSIEDNNIIGIKNDNINGSFLIGDKISKGVYSFSFKMHGKDGVTVGLRVFKRSKCCSFYYNSSPSVYLNILLDYLWFRNDIFFHDTFINYTEDDIITLELDMRSENKEKRTIHEFVNGKQQKTFFNYLPNEVIFYSNISENDSKVEFISFEELKEPKAKKMEDEIGIMFNFLEEEKIEKLNRKKDKISISCATSLSSLHVQLSSNSLTIKDNEIIHTGGEGYETCIIGDIMSEGIYRIAVEIHHTHSLFDIFSIGLIDYSLGCPESGKSITQAHKGIAFETYPGLMKNMTNNIIGASDFFIVCNLLVIEVDLRSKEKEKRTMRIFTNGSEHKKYFNNLPSSVQFALSLRKEGDLIKFLSLEELTKPTSKEIEGIRLDWGREKEEYKKSYDPKEEGLINDLTPPSLSDFKEITSGFNLMKNKRIVRIKNDGESWGRLILDKEMKKGVNLFKFKVKKMKNHSFFGLTDKDIKDFEKDLLDFRENYYHLLKDRDNKDIYRSDTLFIVNEGNNEIDKDIDVWLEIDMRSEDLKKRIMHCIINGEQQETFFYNLPENVRVFLVLPSKDDCAEFISWEEIKEPITEHLRWEEGRLFEEKIIIKE